MTASERLVEIIKLLRHVIAHYDKGDLDILENEAAAITEAADILQDLDQGRSPVVAGDYDIGPAAAASVERVESIVDRLDRRLGWDEMRDDDDTPAPAGAHVPGESESWLRTMATEDEAHKLSARTDDVRAVYEGRRAACLAGADALRRATAPRVSREQIATIIANTNSPWAAADAVLRAIGVRDV